MEYLTIESHYPQSLAIAIVFEHFEIENSPFLPSSQLQLKNRFSAVACPDLPSLLYFIRRIHFESGESEFDIDKSLNKLKKIDNIGLGAINQIKTLLEKQKLITLEKINEFLKNLKPIINLNLS